MLAVLASLVLAAAPTSPTTVLPDSEVPRYLRGAELAEWSRARLDYERAQGELTQGQSIVSNAAQPRAPLKGAGFETADQAKARGEAKIREAQSKLQRISQTLDRLRYTATVRHADQTKMVTETIEISGYAWSEGLLVTTMRAQKVARDAGMARHHVLGGWTFDADGKAAASADLAAALRGAWAKVQGDRDFLQEVPAGGYKVTPGADGASPGLAADWTPPGAPSQVALAWAEAYALPDGASLVFVRVADAHTLRLVASECFVSPAPSAPGTLRAAITLRDDRSFLPRIGASGAWKFGYPREGVDALAAASLRHFCARGSQLGVLAGDWISALLGGSARLDDQPNVLWKLRAVPGAKGDYQVSAQPVGAAAATEVGVLSLRVDTVRPAEKPAEPVGKPAGK